MAANWRILCILLWCVSMHILGLNLFSKGFLLSRVQIRNVTDCDSSSSSSSSCSPPTPKFSKFVFIVVDALRFDFADHDASIATSADNLKPFQNKMPIFRRLETADAAKAKLFEFIADPPTTTMQRLQGLTTGSLPTFVDIGANFDGYQVVEDNFLSQLNSSGKSVVFMGDDTWTNLFPRHFLRQYPFPSFDVRDLHTVDNGVKKHFFPELAKTDWTLLIAHMLGVDHCGHRYGPDHPEMAAKLTETNAFLEDVVDNMDDDTLLVVLGDHGMTSSGDHGGDSTGELSSALFVHAKKPFLDSSLSASSPSSSSPSRPIPQIDLIPTLSLLAGVAIPFSNLGKPILELFPDAKERSIALDAVVSQVDAYLNAYRLVADDIPAADSRRLSELFDEIRAAIAGSDEDDDESAEEARVRFLETVRAVCERVWAKFDVVFIVVGLVVSLIVALVVVTLFCDTRIFVEDAAFTRLGGVFGVSTLVSGAELVLAHSASSASDAAGAADLLLLPRSQGLVGFSFAVVAFVFAVKSNYFGDSEDASSRFVKLWHRVRSPSRASVVATVVVAVLCACAFSNSFVVSEDRVVHFAFLSVAWFVVVKTVVEDRNSTTSHSFKDHPTPPSQGNSTAPPPSSSSSKSSRGAAKSSFGDVLLNWRFLLLSLTFVASCALTWSRVFGQSCREEQFWCETSQFIQPLSSFQKGRHLGLALNIRYFCSVAVVSGVVFLLWRLLRHDGNLSGESLPVLAVKYALPAAVLCLCLHWASHDKLPAWQRAFMPRGVYALTSLVLVALIWNPLLVYLVHFPRPEDGEETRLSLGKGSAEDLIRAAYRRIKMNWKNHLKSTTTTQANGRSGGGVDAREEPLPPPHAYGLATAYSAAFLVLLVNFSVLAAMLLGDGLVFSLALYLATLISWLEIYSATRWPCPEALRSATGSTFAAYLLIPWWTIVGWGLLSAAFYFYTGHQSSIPNIPWNAAFHGVVGHHVTRVVPALLVSLNVFVADVAAASTLPLLALWPYARGKVAFYFSQRHVSPAVEKKCEVALQDNPRVVGVAMMKLALGFILFSSLRSSASMAAAALHRRHLMVWKIFAPRFIFESARFGVTGVFVLLGVAFFLRVDRLIRTWLQSVQDRIAKR